MKDILPGIAFVAFILFCIVAALFAPDPRIAQREACAEMQGRYIQMPEFDDDICLTPNGPVGFDD